MLDFRIVVCPKCDAEHEISIEDESVRCSSCGEVFEPHKMRHDASPEFWHHPLNSAAF